MEAGILNWGADMTLEDNVYEAGLDWLIDEGKSTDYIGREALQRIKQQGVTRKLVGIEIAGAPVGFNTSKWPVSAGGKTVGQVTSAIWSPRLKQNLGYAMLPAALTAPGSEVQVELPGGETRSAKVVQKPFVDPKKEIPKA